jgi:hypothetical protein
VRSNNQFGVEEVASQIAAIWLVGGAVCTLAYLIGIWPAFRQYTRMSGVVFEVFHFGTRAIRLLALWPVFTVLFVYIWLGERGRAQPGDTPDRRGT